MTQAELNRAVARATGESMSTIRDLGFQLAEVVRDDPDDDADELLCQEENPTDDDFDRGPRVFDWDEFTAVSLEEFLAAA